MKTQEKVNRKWIFAILSSFFLVNLFAGCEFLNKETEGNVCLTEPAFEKMKGELEAREVVNRELELVLRELDATLGLIREEGSDLWNTGGENRESRGNLNERLIDNASVIDKMLKSSRLKVSELSWKLNDAQMEIDLLEERITRFENDQEKNAGQLADLEKELEEKQILIKKMQDEILHLVEGIHHSEGRILDQQVEIALLQSEQNSVYLAKGNFVELKAKGVVHKEKGFLGFKIQKAVDPLIDEEAYQKLNRNGLDQIDIGAKKARLISDHPGDSYSWMREDDVILALAIEDPDEFWKKSKYLVVEIK